MNIINLKIVSIISFITLACTNALAQDLDIQDIEQSLNIKTKDNCKSPPCPADIDSLLIKLTDEHTKERDNNQVNDSEEESNIENNNSPLVKMDRAEIIILNKITAKSKRTNFKLGEVKFFGNLSIEVHKCIKSTDPFNANNFMLLTVLDNKIESENLSVFHGWLLSSNPSLSTVEHPVYEILPIECLPAEQ